MNYRGRIAGVITDRVPIITCRIAGPGGFDHQYSGGLSVRALVDTGADHVSIRPEHVAMLGLQKTGALECDNIGFSGPIDSYVVDLAFDMVAPAGQPFRLLIDGSAALCPTGFANIMDIILPMTVLQKFTATFLPSGYFELTYQDTPAT